MSFLEPFALYVMSGQKWLQCLRNKRKNRCQLEPKRTFSIIRWNWKVTNDQEWLQHEQEEYAESLGSIWERKNRNLIFMWKNALVPSTADNFTSSERGKNSQTITLPMSILTWSIWIGFTAYGIKAHWINRSKRRKTRLHTLPSIHAVRSESGRERKLRPENSIEREKTNQQQYDWVIPRIELVCRNEFD